MTTRKVSESADALSDQLHRAEDFFYKLNYGARAGVDLGDGNRLWFGKFGGEWKLFLNEEQDLFGSSLLVRQLAAERIPDLHQAIMEAARNQGAAIQAAADKLCAWLDQNGAD